MLVWNFASRAVSQRDHKNGKRSNMYKNNLKTSFVVALEIGECPSVVEWLNKLCYMNVMEYYCAIRNDEQADFRKTWKDLYELMLSEVS